MRLSTIAESKGSFRINQTFPETRSLAGRRPSARRSLRGPSGVGDEEFAKATQPYLLQMVATARRILSHDAEAAEDAVQEALLELWLHEEGLTNPGAWLIRAVTLRSLHLARCLRRRRIHERRARLRCNEGSSHDDPAEGLNRRDVACSVRDALDGLRPEYRAVLMV